MLFSETFRPVKKLLIKHNHTWQCGQRSTEYFWYRSLINAEPILQILR